MDTNEAHRAVNELRSAAQVGIANYLSTTRGAALLGAGAKVQHLTRRPNVLLVGDGSGDYFEVTITHHTVRDA